MRVLPVVPLLIAGCEEKPLCDAQVVGVARDTGSDRYAVTEVRNCGATTDFATVVRIGRASKAQNDAREVFVADSDHGAASQGEGNAIWMQVVWTAPGQLLVNYASKARTFKLRSSAEGASVRFRAADPIGGTPMR